MTKAKETTSAKEETTVTTSTATIYNNLFTELDSISKKDFDALPLADKAEYFKKLLQYNSLNLDKLESLKRDKDEAAAKIKAINNLIKSKKETSKSFADKFGKIEKLTKKDFVLFSYLNWNNPKLVISKAVEIWDFCAKSTLTTINAFGGSLDTNKKFIELIRDYHMQIAQTKTGMKVYKIDSSKLDADKLKEVTKLENLTIDDFKQLAEQQRAKVELIKNDNSTEVLEVDKNLKVVDLDF